MQSLMMLIPLLFSPSVNDPYAIEYNKCIKAHTCIHDREDLTKLHKDEYIRTMQCRIERHLQCIKTETETIQ